MTQSGLFIRSCAGMLILVGALSLAANAAGESTRPQSATDALFAASFAPDTGQLIPLPRFSEAELHELAEDFVLHLELTRGLKRMDAQSAAEGGVPAQVRLLARAARSGAAGGPVLLVGVVNIPRRLPQLWLGGGLRVELGDLAAALREVLRERLRLTSQLRLADLESRIMNLSYVDADSALTTLRAMGYSAVTQDDPLPRQEAYWGEDVEIMRGLLPPEPPESAAAAAPTSVAGLLGNNDARTQPPRNSALRYLPATVSLRRLPLIIKVPTPDARAMGLAGGGDSSQSAQAQRDQLGLTVIPQAASNLSDTVAGAASQLMVLHHPDYPEQLARVRKVIQDVIDKPARQVFVEGLVLEISQEGLRELGVKWDLKKGDQAWSIGNIGEVVPGSSTLSFMRDSLASISPTQIMARISALVEKNQAEVLSRPSVLTLDNRQATIRVGTDIPVSTSKDASSAGQGSSRVAFSFQYIPTGILLNVRPRLNEEGTEVSMVIDATVSATVPGRDLQVLDPATRIPLASAPTISTRRVQTYARIRDNTPLIIGGLVSRDQINGSAGVPGLSRVPLVGRIFGSESATDNKREVIIVLTPSVVTENIRETKAQYPRDDERFDQLGTGLFKDHYRIRPEDLVDSSYFRFNRRYLAYRDAMKWVLDARPELATREPYAAWHGGRVPAELSFVAGMMYRLMDRLQADRAIALENLGFYERSGAAGAPRKVSIAEVLARHGDGKTPESFFVRNPGRALALSFRAGRLSTRAEDVFVEAEPEVSLVDVPDREAWRNQLWALNQPREGGRRFTILLHQPEDLRRLKLAIATQNTILNNGGVAGVTFDRWLPGRLLHLQETSPNWQRLLLAPIAQYFFLGEHYYPAFMQEFGAALDAAERELKAPALTQWAPGNLP